MNAQMKWIGGFLFLFLLMACGNGKQNTKGGNLLDDCTVIGKVVQVGDDKVISCDQREIKNAIRIPVSALVEDVEYIWLDNREDALVGNTRVVPSDNYLLVWGEKQNPFKLFDRKGHFITAIGSYGQGPNEYLNVYDAQLDEINNRIFLLPWQSDKILVFDLQGNSYPPIPICIRAPKGVFHVDYANETVAVVLLPFQGLPAVAWTQDFEGNRKTYIEPGHLEAPQDYSNEVLSGRNTDVFDVSIHCIMPTRVDSLYHYDVQNNRLRPCFTMNFMDDPIPWHGYTELPNYYIGNISSPVQVAAGMFEPSKRTFYIIDKQTLRGAYVQFVNDLMFENIHLSHYDGFELPYFSLEYGYFIQNMEPAGILENIDIAIKSGKLSDKELQELRELQASIHDNDNNCILLARLKK